MAPKAEKQPAKKVAKSVDGSKKKGKKQKTVETYKIYIYKVLKQVSQADKPPEPLALSTNWYVDLGPLAGAP